MFESSSYTAPRVKISITSTSAFTLPASIVQRIKTASWVKLATVSLFAAVFFCGQTASAQLQTSGIVTLAPQLKVLAGGGSGTPSATPAPGTTLQIPSSPVAVVRDRSGNIYFSDQYFNQTVGSVEKLTPSGNLTIFAGGGSATPVGGAPIAPLSAQIDPAGLAVDGAGNLYIADILNNVVEVVSSSGRNLTVIAGGGSTMPTTTPATPASVSLSVPYSLAIDISGNLYIADRGHGEIDEIDISTGQLYVIAGTTNYISPSPMSASPVPATNVIVSPNSIAVDNLGHLYIAEQSAGYILQLDLAAQTLRVIAGPIEVAPPNPATIVSSTPSAGIFTQIPLPLQVSVDAVGDVYSSPVYGSEVVRWNHLTQEVSTVSLPLSSLTSIPEIVDFVPDSSGNFYIADSGNNLIYEITPNNVFPTTALGPGSSSQTVDVQLTGDSELTGITVPVAQDGSQEFTVGDLSGSGCTFDGVFNNSMNTVCAVPIVFKPTEPGLRTGALTLHNGPNVVGTVGLSGTGTAPQTAFAPGIISTVAGDGTTCATPACGDGGSPVAAQIDAPESVAIDSAGNIYIAEPTAQLIRKISKATSLISTVATGVGANSVVLDAAGNLYYADIANNVVGRIDAVTQAVTTIAGNGVAAYGGDGGPATQASLHAPFALAFGPDGNLYISDRRNNVIREYFPSNGTIITVAGNNAAGGTSGGDGGPATSASLFLPAGIALDAAGNLYIADSLNCVVRKVTAATGIIDLYAGDYSLGISGDGVLPINAQLSLPIGLALDAAGNLYIGDSVANGVRVVTSDPRNPLIFTIAGDPLGSSGSGGDGGPATTAVLSQPAGVAVDAAGNLYIADIGNNVIRQVTVGNTIPLVFPDTPDGTQSSPGALLLYNTGNERLNFADPVTGNNPSIASGFTIDTVDSTCPIATPLSRRPRDLATGESCLTLFAFQPTLSGSYTGSLIFTDNALNVTGSMQSVNLSGTALAGTASQLTFTPAPPALLAPGAYAGVITATITDAGGNPISGADSSSIQLTVTDPNGNSISYGPDATSNGVVTFTDLTTVPVIAGTYTYTVTDLNAIYSSATASETVVPNSSSAIPAVVGLVLPQANTITIGIPTSFTIGSISIVTEGTPNLDFTLDTHNRGSCRDSHTYNAGDTCTLNYFFNPTKPGQRLGAVRIFDTNGTLQVTYYVSGLGYGPLAAFTPGTISTVAGTFSSSGYAGDGNLATDPATQLFNPQSAVVDAAGNIFIADRTNNVIRRVDAVTHIITTYAGNRSAGGTFAGDNGPATAASLNFPEDLVLDGSGNLYIADTLNSAVRKVDAVTGIITTIAGNGTANYTGDGGPAAAAQLNLPQAIAIDASNNLYIADTNNNVIRQVNLGSGIITTIAGGGTGTFTAHAFCSGTSGPKAHDAFGDGCSPTAVVLNQPAGVSVDLFGDIFISDTGNHIVRVISAGTIFDAAGNGTAGNAGNGNDALDSGTQLSQPAKIATDAAGDLYINDPGNFTLRKVDEPTGIITSVIDAITAPIGSIGGVSLDGSGNLYLADAGNSVVDKINVSTPLDLNFGTVPAGLPAGPQTIALSNIGVTQGEFTSLTLSTGFSFDPANTCPAAAGSVFNVGTCNLAIDFKPTAGGVFSSPTSQLAMSYIGYPGETTSTPLTVGLDATATNGSAAELAFINPPATVLAIDSNTGLAVPAAVTAGVADANGGIIPGASDTLTLTITDPNGNAVLCDPSLCGPIATVNGVATFNLPAGISFSASGTYTYTITSLAGYHAGSTLQAVISISTPYIETTIGDLADTTVTVPITTTFILGSIAALSTGIPDVEYTVQTNGDSNQCIVGTTYTPGQTCTVPVGFTPLAAGFRLGAVVLYDQSGVAQTQALLTGLGLGPVPSLTPGTINTIAGNISHGFGYSGDGGLATAAQLNAPQASAIDAAGNIYIVDGGNDTVRRVDGVTGDITTIAGRDGYADYSGDGGPATSARLNFPVNISIDGAGNLYIADSGNGVIRKIGINGIITTVAGNNGVFDLNDGGPATSAGLNEPASARIEPITGDLYIADAGNNRIRRVDHLTGIITTVAGGGNGTCGGSQQDALGDGCPPASSTLSNPSDIVFVQSEIYIADSGNNAIRLVDSGGIHRAVGGNGSGYTGDGGSSGNAQLNNPLGLAVDAAADLYIADTGNFAIRKVNPNTNIVTTVAGNGSGAPYQVPTDGTGATASALGGPASITLDGNANLLIPDYFNGLLSKVNVSATPALNFIATPVGSVTAPQTVTFANVGNIGISSTLGLVLPTNFIADTSGSDPSQCSHLMPFQLQSAQTCNFDIDFAPVEGGTFSATGTPPYAATYTTNFETPAFSFSIGLNGTGVAGPAAQLGFFNGTPPALGYTGSSPGIVQAGVADAGGYLITTASDNITLNISGPTGFTFAPVTVATNAQGIASFDLTALKFPSAGAYTFTATSANSYTQGSAVVQVSNASYNVATPIAVTTPATSSAIQTVIIGFTTAGTLSAIHVTTEGNLNGDFQPATISGGCVQGNTYTAGQTCNVGFTFSPRFPGQRLGAIQLLDNSGATPVLLGQTYLSGIGSGSLAALTPGIINTVAGNFTLGQGYSGEGVPATQAQLSAPIGVTFDANGNLYIADDFNGIVRKVDTSGNINTVAGIIPGSGIFNFGDGYPAVGDYINGPAVTAVDGAGNLYILSSATGSILKVDVNTGLISTIIGATPATYAPPYGDGGPASAAYLAQPTDMVVDAAGNLYISVQQSNNVRRIDANTGIITTIAGGGSSTLPPPYGDGGPATSAYLTGPTSLALDAAGDLYIGDSGHNNVRKVDAITGTITTVTGNGSIFQDGIPATSAVLQGVNALAVDAAGDLYIASSGTVRKVSVATGIISTVAGNGNPGYQPTADGGSATNAALGYGQGLAIDPNGNLLLSDRTDNIVREVSVTTTPGITFPNTNAGVVSDPINVTLSNIGTADLNTTASTAITTNFVFSAVTPVTCPLGSSATTIIASGTDCVYSVTFAPATVGVFTSSTNSLTFADNGLNSTTQVIGLNGTATVGLPTRLIFTPAPAAVMPIGAGPGLTTVSIEDDYGNVITNASDAITFTLTGPNNFSDDFAGASTTNGVLTFNFTGIALPQPGTYVFTAISSSGYISAVANIVVVAGSAVVTTPIAVTSPVTSSTVQTVTVGFNSAFTLGSINAVTQGQLSLDFNTAPGSTCIVNHAYNPGDTCSVNFTFSPTAPGQRFGAILVESNDATPILESTTLLSGIGTGAVPVLTPGIVNTIVGSSFTTQQLNEPKRILADAAGDLFISDTYDGLVLKRDPAGNITTYAGSDQLSGSNEGDGLLATDPSVVLRYPVGLAIDGAGDLYITDQYDYTVRRVDGLTHIITTVAGANGLQGYTGDGGLATAATLSQPLGIAVDAAGDLYIADSVNGAVRKVDANTGIISTVAGGGSNSAPSPYGDGGPAIGASFNGVNDVIIDPAGNLYIADQNHQAVRKVDAVSGNISTLASVLIPESLALDAAGNVYAMSAFSMDQVQKISPAGAVTTVVSALDTGFYNPSDEGAAANAIYLDFPQGIAIDGTGNLYIADTFNNLVRKVSVGTTVPLNFATAQAGNSTDAQTVMLSNIGNADLATTSAIAPSDFTVTAAPNTCPVTSAAGSLVAGVNCVYSIAFTPTTGTTYTSPSSAFTVADALGPQTVGLNAISVKIAPDTRATLTNAVAGVPYSQTITVTGGTSPYSFTLLSGTTMQAGLTLNATTGVISGTPTATGTTSFIIGVTDSATTNAFSGSVTYTLTVDSPVIVLSPSTGNTTTLTGTVGASYSQQITASGGTPAYSYTINGTLPAGVTFSSTGLISGTPTEGGVFTFGITATDQTTGDNAPYTGAQFYSLTIASPTIAVTQTTLPAGAIAASYSQQLTASNGTAPYSFTSTTLPAGLTLSSAGLLSGTPTAGGVFSITFTAHDSSTGTGPYTGQQTISLTINAPTIVIPQTTLPSGAIAAAYTASQFSASGGTSPYTFTATGLPAGLSLSTSGLLTGTPTAGGTFSIVVTAHDSSTGTGPYTGSSATISLTINAPTVAVTQTTLPAGAIAAAYSQQLTASGGTSSYSFTSTTLPSGLTLSSTGLLSGTPTAGGVFSITFTAHDSSTGTGPYTGQQIISLTIAAPIITVPQTMLPTGAVAATYTSSQFTASGGTSPYTYTATGLPAGLTLSTSGLLSGTPTAGGIFSVVVTAHDASTGSGPYTGSSSSISLTIAAPTITVPQTTLPAGTVAAAYTASQFSASGGTSPYTFTATGLPAGLTLSTSGLLTGTPTAGGSFSVVVAAQDSSTGSGPFTGASATISLTIASPTIVVTQTTLSAGTVAASYTAPQFTASGGTSSYTFTATGLPAGLTLSTSGLLTGTPSAGGTFSVVVTAHDSSTGAGPYTGQQTISLTINAPTITVPQTTLSAGTVAAAYTASLFTASGGTSPYTFTATGLPAGLTLSSAGLLSGTPTAGGTFSVVVTAHDASTGTGPYTGSSSSISLTINAPTLTLAPTPGTLALATGNVAYSQQFTAGGGTAPYQYTITAGALPTGITLDRNSGLLSGTSTVPEATFSFTVTATDSSTGTGPYTQQGSYSFHLNPALPISSSFSTGVIFNSSNNVLSLSLSGGLAASVAITASPMHGNASASGTTITYTPTSGYTGPDSISYTATNVTGTSSPAGVITIQVGKIPVTVTLGNLAPTYSAAPQSVTTSTAITSSSAPVTVSSITVTYNGSSTPPTLAGAYTVVATVVDPLYQGTATTTMNIGQAPTSVVLAQTLPATTGVGTGVAATFTATVLDASLGSTGAPTGRVQFFDNGTSLGIRSMTDGVATLVTTFTTATTHPITAQYLSDMNFAGNTSGTLNESVVIPSFSIVANPNSISIQHGSSGTATLTFTPVGNYQGTLSLACNGLPAFSSCQFTPSSITFTGNNAVQTSQLVVYTLNAAAVTGTSSNGLLWIPACLLACFVALRRRKLGFRPLLMFAVAAFALAAMTALTGCGSSAHFVTPAGTDIVTVTASATGTPGTSSSNTTQTATITITITN